VLDGVCNPVRNVLGLKRYGRGCKPRPAIKRYGRGCKPRPAIKRYGRGCKPRPAIKTLRTGLQTPSSNQNVTDGVANPVQQSKITGIYYGFFYRRAREASPPAPVHFGLLAIKLIYNGINKCTLDAPTFAKKTLN
jgi:hypothetical protein